MPNFENVEYNNGDYAINHCCEPPAGFKQICKCGYDRFILGVIYQKCPVCSLSVVHYCSYISDATDNRLPINNPLLTRAVTGYLSLKLAGASSIVIDGFMNEFGLNILGFDGMRVDELICMAKADKKSTQNFWFSISEQNHEDVFFSIPALSKEHAEQCAQKIAGLTVGDKKSELVLNSHGLEMENMAGQNEK